MVRSYSVYLREGMKNSKITIKQKGNKIKIILFTLLYLANFSLLFLEVAKARISKQSIRMNDIDVIDSFRNISNIKVFLHAVIAHIIRIAMYGAVILGTALITLPFAYIGYTISQLSQNSEPTSLIIIFSIPAILFGIVALVDLTLYLSPVAYICDTVSVEQGSTIIKKSFESMRKGKRIVLFNILIPRLIVLVFMGLTAGVLFITSTVNPLIHLLAIFAIIVLWILFLIVAPRFLLGFENANTLLFEDTVMDSVMERKQVKGIVVRNGGKGTNADNLINLFEKTEERHVVKKSRLNKKEARLEKVNEYKEEPKVQEEVTKPVQEEVTKPVQEEVTKPVEEEVKEPLQEETGPIEENVNENVEVASSNDSNEETKEEVK